MKVYKSQDRALTQIPWLTSYHSFSFGEHYDPNNKGWGNLRVINEDKVAASKGFDFHYHRDMEIITYVVSGQLEHKDSAGNHYTISPGEVQRISAGAGIMHSEYNPSSHEPAHFMQIWIKPNIKKSPASYQQKKINFEPNTLNLIASEKPSENTVSIKQEAKIYAAKFDHDGKLEYQMQSSKVWIQVIEASVALGDVELLTGDAIAIDGRQLLQLKARAGAHFLLFDL